MIQTYRAGDAESRLFALQMQFCFAKRPRAVHNSSDPELKEEDSV